MTTANATATANGERRTANATATAIATATATATATARATATATATKVLEPAALALSFGIFASQARLWRVAGRGGKNAKRQLVAPVSKARCLCGCQGTGAAGERSSDRAYGASRPGEEGCCQLLSSTRRRVAE